MRVENGPPLSVAGHLRRTPELQGLFIVFDLYLDILLGVFRDGFAMGVAGDLDRNVVY